jgi:hypothetical protein
VARCEEALGVRWMHRWIWYVYAVPLDATWTRIEDDGAQVTTFTVRLDEQGADSVLLPPHSLYHLLHSGSLGFGARAG